MKAKMIIDFSESYCKEISKNLDIATGAELLGVLKLIFADEISEDDEVKVSLEVEE